MAKKILLDDDSAETGMKYYFEPTSDGFLIHTVGATDPIIEENKKKRSMGRAYYAADKDMWRIACIPNIILLKWANDAGVPAHQIYSDEFSEWCERKLRDPDFRDFKTADIRI